ncbi:MAG: response regulator receiver protein [Deltaproteobacteria bacterium]|nr:response regulator receiver protein [Deltaproteobacteria bacterium]
MKICIVENDKLLRDSLVLLFRTKGCDVREFTSAEDALREPEFPPPDIVVSDQNLPGMDGLEFLLQVAIRYRGAVRILIDAYPSGRFAAEAKQAGIEEYLLKPFSIGDIDRVMKRWLSTRANGAQPRDGADEDPNQGFG